MRKILFALSLLFVSIMLVSCGDKEENTGISISEEVTILTPNGTPYVAIAGVLGTENVKIETVAGAANLQTALASGSHDIVIAPVNVGANLYNKGNSKYQISHIITSNNVYIVTRSENELNSIINLKDQKVLGFSPAGIPASVLKKLYSNNGLDISNVDFQYPSSAAVYAAFAGNLTDAKYALMSEPEITKLTVKEGISVKTLDLTKELGVDVAQACVFVNPESNQEVVNQVLALINKSVKSLNEDTTSYVDRIIKLDRIFESTGREVLINSIPKTNIVFKEAKTNKNDVETILNILGVALPNDEFYR